MISWTTVLIVAIACLFCEAFFSGSEIALVSANKTKLKQRANAGDRGARLAEAFLARPEQLLATTLMGTNLALVTISVTVALALLGRDSSSGELLAVAVVTPMTLILGEVVPKTLGQRYADALVPKIVYPLRFAFFALRPGVWIMSGFAAVVTRALGVERQRAFVTRDELALLIDSDTTSGSDITKAEREMIANLLDLSDSEVVDVMVPLSEVTALPADTTIADAMLEIADKQHSRMPVFEDRIDNVVGVLHVFDLLRIKDQTTRVADVARPAAYAPENQPAADLLVDLQATGNHMAVVVDEYGGAVGVVTVEDILEEVVGEIDDEYDQGPSPIKQERAGVWTALARTSVERVNAELDLDLPVGDEYESIAGLLLDRLKRIPEHGESVEFGSITVRVIEANDRSVEKVQILRRKR